MRKQKIVVNTELSMIDYLVMVNDMVLEYFNEDGEYQPHIGMLNVMRLFYNHCVIESKFDTPHDIIDAMDMEIIVEDDDFLNAFNEAIIGDSSGIRMNFSNAYKDAMDIVETKKQSVERAVGSIKKALSSIIDTINPLLTDEHIEKVSEIARDVASGKLSAEAIVDAYGKSNRFKQVVNSNEKDEVANRENVVSIDHLSKK